jgi:SOS-response transcriptional repressor LexA
MSLNVLNMGRKKEKELTPAQKEIFLVIDEFWKKYGFAPSIEDVMYITGEKGRGNVSRKMWRLVELGICKGIKGKMRSIRPSYIKVRNIE